MIRPNMFRKGEVSTKGGSDCDYGGRAALRAGFEDTLHSSELVVGD